MSDGPLEDLLRVQPGDAGCAVGEAVLDEYVGLVLAGKDPGLAFPGTAIHFQSCPGCRADFEGLLEAARRLRPGRVVAARPPGTAALVRSVDGGVTDLDGTARGSEAAIPDRNGDVEWLTC